MISKESATRMACWILCLFCSCVSDLAYIKHKGVVTRFYAMSTSDQIVQFGSYDIDTQYALYIYGNQEVHPPAIYLAKPFARQGAPVVSFLREKLKLERREVVIRDIALVFSEMSRLKAYDFSKDVELMSLLEKIKVDMRGVWRDTTINFIEAIKKGSVTEGKYQKK